MNVLFLTADSLRADRTSLFGHSRDTTPFLDDFAEGGVEFRRAYSNGRNTAAAFPAIHTSIHQRYFDGIGIPDGGPPTLAETLRRENYRTHAIHTNELISKDYNYDRGFEVYRDSRSADSSDADSWRARMRDWIGDGVLFELVKRAHFLSTRFLGLKVFDTADAVSGFEDLITEWATEDEDDWFIWAHYMNAHHPYEPPGDCQTALGLDPIRKRDATRLSRKMRLQPEDVTAAERDKLRGLYDAAVRSFDDELSSTIRSLKRAGALEDTLVVITADHGELLGEGGRWGHPPVLSQELLRVPLVISGPMEAGQTESPVSLIDLPPTILTIADAEVPDTYQGRSLLDSGGGLSEGASEPIIAETGAEDRDLICAIEGNRKLVCDVDTSEWAPFRLDGLGYRQTATGEEYPNLRQAINRHIEAARKARWQGAEIDEDALRGDLAALGYLDE